MQNVNVIKLSVRPTFNRAERRIFDFEVVNRFKTFYFGLYKHAQAYACYYLVPSKRTIKF